MINFNNTYAKLPERFFERVQPARFPAPQLIRFNHELAKELEINTDGVSEQELALVFSGQKILPGSEPMALAYAAHQFGHFVPQLGDGRAHLLGEVKGFDIQLKGSGQTRFSRNGDGRSALGPVLREYIVSEAMAAFGVPTTRALAAVTTGEDVYRTDVEPGGVFTRVAPSHIRVGTFQYFAARQDAEALKILLNYAIGRHYPKLQEIESLPTRAIAFIQAVGEAQASLIAQWLSFGFIHGVMNTDNSAVGGFTLDFGPCAFMDEYKKNKVFSSIDRNGRYAYSNQPGIGQWNLLRLAECLLSLIDQNQDSAVAKVNEVIPAVMAQFEQKQWAVFARKFGINDYREEDQVLIKEFLDYLEAEELDFTLAFRNLSDLYAGDNSHFFPNVSRLDGFLQRWKNRVANVQQLHTINPLFIPRNHQIERAIESAKNGDYQIFHELVEVLKSPFQENAKYAAYAIPPKTQERVTQTFCGT